MTTSATSSSDRILQAALELFSSRGYDATSVREICEAAGITKPTLYYFYGSKDGLYRALVDGALEDIRRDLARRLEAPGNIQERLERVTRCYFDTARARRQLMRFILGLVYGPPGSAPATDFHRFYQETMELIARSVEEGVAQGELRPGPLEVRMLVLMGAIGEALCGYLLLGHPDLTDSLADALVEAVLEGWRPGDSQR